MMSFLDAEGMELIDSMLGQSGSCVWKVRAGKGGKYRLARNLGMTNSSLTITISLLLIQLGSCPE